MNIHERHKASQSLMNMILAAGFVQNVETFESEKHGISMIFNVRDNAEGFTPQGRPREEKRKRDNNHNFEAKVKRGDLRSFTLH